MRTLPIKKRRHIEIYFILYLAALVLLIPDKSDEGTDDIYENSTPVIQQNFKIYPDKTTLTCALTRDSSGIAVVSFDSVNTIFFTGKVEDVRFEFIVEDRSLRQKLVLNTEEKTTSKLFRIEEDIAKNRATFYWDPPLEERFNKSLQVKVNATARQKRKGSSDNESGLVLKDQTQFSLNIIFLDSDRPNLLDSSYWATGVFPVDSARLDMLRNQLTMDKPDAVELDAGISTLEHIAYHKWKHEVFLKGGNFEKDIKDRPIIKVTRSNSSNGGKASILQIRNFSILIAGITPSVGDMKVEISARRKLDNKKITTFFKVRPKKVRPPEYPRLMHPENSYKIVTNLPQITGLNVNAVLKDAKTERKLAESPDGLDFVFTPSRNDIGKLLYLELYVESELFGQVYQIQVEDWDNPEILRLQEDGPGKIRLQTRSFGMYGSKENTISKLVIDGNAVDREDWGRPMSGSGDKVFTQIFFITPKDPDKPFKFTVYAVDQRGRKTSEKAFPD